MKKLSAILLVVMMMGALVGCYSKSCETPCTSYKGEG